MNVVIEENQISEQIKSFWQIESLGIVDNETETSDIIGNEILKEFEDNIAFENKRYRVKLPWKSDVKDLLPNNREIALERFCKLNLKFRNNPFLFSKYKEVIDEYLRQDIIEPVIQAETDQIVFYLPHRAVLKENRLTSQLRIVFDGSSHTKGKLSLNDCLHPGPNLYNNLFELLLSFREYPVAFIFDIRQAFLNIEIDESDRDVTRFFWTDNPHSDSPPSVYRFTRVLFGINSSPFLLSATIKHHLAKMSTIYPSTSKLLERSCYVDDIIAGDVNVNNALSTTSECIQIFEKAGMQLHKFQTNSEELRELWIKNGITTQTTSETIGQTGLTYKVLGISWKADGDYLYFDSNNLLKFLDKQIDSKRYLLQVAGRIFDPLGFIGPFTVRIKCLIQEVWACGVDWDEELPPPLKEIWKVWCSELQGLDNILIPRRYLMCDLEEETNQVELHCFSDSSKKAYGTVIYLRFVMRDGSIRTSFVASKSRIAPLKSLSLPRLELMGALLSARLCQSIKKRLKYQLSCYFWTDSSIVYYWIRGDSSRFKPFVKNRIEEIQRMCQPSNWLHCPGFTNPSDILSRGISVDNLKHSLLWWQGPEWLQQPRENWPTQKLKTVDKEDLEYRKRVLVNDCIVKNSELIDVERYSNLQKVIRIFAYVKRFIHKTRKQPFESGPLTAVELETAEIDLIKNVQRNTYFQEICALEKHKTIPADSNLVSLSPFLDERGVLRIKGRIEEGDYTLDEKHPIILSKNSKFTELLVKREHEKVLHSGVSATLTKIRKRYWIPKGRQLIKKIIRKCLICKRYAAKPGNQITAQLPKDRMTETPPFTICGLDFAGPIIVRNGKETKKSYIALFTCAVTRAIHLELVSDMSAECFLLAFRRFQSRRGTCNIIYSDNAKSFKSAAKELQKIYSVLKNPKFQDFISSQNITWKFIVERAPWWGGFYERLVKSIKDPLRKILGKALLTFEELSTLLAEIEAVINQRPLTFVYDSFGEPSPLTPDNFLKFGREGMTLPIGLLDLETKISTKDSLLKRKAYQARLLKQLWIKWKNQYLLDLKTLHHLKTPQIYNDFKTGDVVLVEGTTKSKFLWDLAVVKEILKGRDGHSRAAIVKTAKGQIRRPIQLLYPMEL